MKAIILAAGHGTRMLPITKTIPKELLPVGNKPVIHYIVEGLSKAGIKDMLIITSQSKIATQIAWFFFITKFSLSKKVTICIPSLYTWKLSPDQYLYNPYSKAIDFSSKKSFLIRLEKIL